LTKAELEWQFNQFTLHAQQCESYHRAGAFFGSLEAAAASLSFADGMLQYSKRFGNGNPKSLATADYIVYYAPLLFHRASLQRLDDCVSASRRLAKGETWDYTNAVLAARQRMELARTLWNALEEHGELGQRELTAIFGSPDRSIQHISKAWTEIAIIAPVPDRGDGSFQFTTSLGRPCDAKCANCGAVTTAPKSIFLEESECPACRTSTHFVLIG
jgi:hypothetical protein